MLPRPFRFNTFITKLLPPTKERKDMKSLTASPSLKSAGNSIFEVRLQEEERRKEEGRREEGRREQGKGEERVIKRRREERIKSKEQEVLEEEEGEEEEMEGNKRKEEEVNVEGLERRCVFGYGSLNKLLNSEDDIRRLEIPEEQLDCVIEDSPNEVKAIAKNDYMVRVTNEFENDKTENENLLPTQKTTTGGTFSKEEEENLLKLTKLEKNDEEGDNKQEREEEKEEDDKNMRDLWGDEEEEDVRFRYQEQYRNCK